MHYLGELSRMNIDERSEQIAFKSWYWENLEKYTSFLLLYKNIKDRTSLTLRDRGRKVRFEGIRSLLNLVGN